MSIKKPATKEAAGGWSRLYLFSEPVGPVTVIDEEVPAVTVDKRSRLVRTG